MLRSSIAELVDKLRQAWSEGHLRGCDRKPLPAFPKVVANTDALTRREYHPARQAPASRSFLLAAGADGRDGQAGRSAAAGAPP
jgi:hypothetical protein